MSRGPDIVRRPVLEGALKAVAGAGVQVARIEIERDSKIVIIPGKPTADDIDLRGPAEAA